MNQNRFLISTFCLILSLIIAESLKAEEVVEYYKAGDVGVFSASFEIPADIAVDTTVFTTRASNEKIYLLYVQPPQSVAKRLTQVMRPSRQSNLSQIGLALLIYANDHDAKLPQNLQELVEEGHIAAENLESPRKPRGFDGPSYIYIGGHDLRRAEMGDILVYENPAFCTDKINVLFIDGHVETMSPTGFLEGLEATYKRLGREMPEIGSEAHKRAVAEQKPTVTEPRAEAARSLKVFGRFQGSSKVRLSVLGRDSAELLAKPITIASVYLELPSENGGNADLLTQWATAQAKEYVVRVLDSPHSSYYQYCLLQSEKKYDLSDSLFRGIFGNRRDRRGRRPDLYAMTTGALAIQESLQLEEMREGRDIPSEHNILLSTLKGPEIKSHPFDKMLQGRTPKTFPVAALIPYDNYYCHFTSISKEIAASDLIKQWGASLLRSITVTARDSDLQSRYMDQVCIDISSLTRLFGDYVIGEIAITGGDPFLKEGSDVALIIEVKSRRVFNTMMNSHAKKALKANGDARVSESKYEGTAIRSILTPDRRISSHSAYLGDYKVYSNSMDMLQMIINTYSKKRKSMAENLDFKYMRTIFPGTPAAEDGFIYMSDSFIRKLLSARWKIEAQRRIICQNHLRMIANAATMYKTEMRKKAKIETLLEEKYLSAKVNRCPDNGSYSLDETGRAFCTVHNCLQYCTPITSVALDGAAKSEAADYRQFVRRYNNLWSRYFDPIGIRLSLGNRIEAETCILPLIENSAYNRLREIIGGEPVQLGSQVLTKGTIASVTSKLHLDSEILNEIDQMQKQILPTLPPFRECLGDSLSLNLYDSDVLFTFAEESMGIFGGWMGFDELIIIGLIASSINLPVYAVVDLEDEDLARTFIRELLKVYQRRIATEWDARDSEFFSIERYSAGQYRSHTIDTLVLRLLVVKFRLHYAIASGRLIVSTKRYVLEQVLDSLDAKQASKGERSFGNVQLNIRPSAFDKLRPIIRIGWQERMREACHKNIGPVRVLVECHDATEKNLNAISRKVEGVTLRCPSGGAYKYDSARDIVYCTVHGNRNHPRQPVQIKENEGLLDFINRMTDFSVRLRFTEEGIMTKVAFELERKKK